MATDKTKGWEMQVQAEPRSRGKDRGQNGIAPRLRLRQFRRQMRKNLRRKFPKQMPYDPQITPISQRGRADNQNHLTAKKRRREEEQSIQIYLTADSPARRSRQPKLFSRRWTQINADRRSLLYDPDNVVAKTTLWYCEQRGQCQ